MKKLILFLILGMFLVSSVFGAEYQLKKVSELQVGDVMVDSEGNEIVVDKIESSGRVQESYTYQESESLMSVLWGKIYQSPTGHVVSGGSSELGLSLGDMGVGVKMISGVVGEISQPKVEEKKSFWEKLMFWRRE